MAILKPILLQPWQQWLVPRKLNPIRQPRRAQNRAKRVSTPHPFMNDLLTGNHSP
jgi:hypothetical protein